MEVAEESEIRRVDNVFLRKGPRPAQLGTLVLTGHHFIFSPAMKRNSLDEDNTDFMLLHRAVDRVLSEPLTRDDPSKGGLLALKCKNFLICIFEVPNYDDCVKIARSVEKLSNLSGVEYEYPFFYFVPFQVLDDGWTAFDLEAEFAKLTLRAPDTFRISYVNENYEICPSYPEKVIVPKGIGDDYLRISATFRDGFRFPVLSYYHHPTKSSIMRCGQPLIGPANRRCKEDETILNSLLAKERGIIIDTRNKAIATASKSKGGGCESQMYYSQWRYTNFSTPRIRELHDMLDKVVDLCNDRSCSSDRWISRLNQSHWLHGVSDMLTAAANVAQAIQCEGSAEVPVLVHGGEGTDSTLVVTSLAQVILDPDARTIRGFEAVIEREFINAGHPFSLRNSHCAYAEGGVTGPREAPVFLCFLDCVHQIMEQFPLSFEFTEQLLIFLFEHAYASEFGSFLGNNEKDKAMKAVKGRTVSLWSYLNNPEILRGFVNTLYEPNEKVIWPSVAPQSIKLWERVFLRWQRDWSETDRLVGLATEWKEKEKALMAKAYSLRRQVTELSREASLVSSAQQIRLSEE